LVEVSPPFRERRLSFAFHRSESFVCGCPSRVLGPPPQSHLDTLFGNVTFFFEKVSSPALGGCGFLFLFFTTPPTLGRVTILITSYAVALFPGMYFSPCVPPCSSWNCSASVLLDSVQVAESFSEPCSLGQFGPPCLRMLLIFFLSPPRRAGRCWFPGDRRSLVDLPSSLPANKFGSSVFEFPFYLF